MGIYGMGKAFNLRYQQTQAAPRRMNMYTRFQAGPPSLMGYGFGGQSITNITYNNGPTGFWGFMSGFLNSGILNNLGSGSLFGNQSVQQQPQGSNPVQQQQQQQQPVQQQQQQQQPVQQQEEPVQQQEPPATPKLRGYAKDNGIIARTGITANEANGPAQWVEADADGELEINGGTADKPDTIVMKDNTNNTVNTYTYKALTDAEVKEQGLDPANGPYYKLESAVKADGSNLRKDSHLEIFKLNISTDGDIKHYNLEQDEGMAGYNNSSIDYSRRG